MFWKSSSSSRITLFDQAIVSGCALLIGLLLVRVGSLELYGSYVLIYMGILLASSLQQAFILTPMLTIYPKELADAQDSYLEGTARLQAVFAVLASVGATIWVLISLFWAQAIPFTFPLAMGAFLIQSYGRRLFFLQGKAEKALALDLIAYGGMVVSVLILGIIGEISLSAIFGIMATTFGGAVGWIARHILPRTFSLKTCYATWLRHWAIARWLGGAALLQFFSSNFFVLAAGPILGHAAVGAIRMIQSLMGGLHVLFLAMENVVPMNAAKALKQDGLSGLFQYLKVSTLKIGALTGALLLTLLFTGEALMEFVYGGDALVAAPLVVPFCLLYVLIFLGYPLRYALLSLEFTPPVLWAYALNILFSMVVASLFLHTWGLIGISYGMMIAQVIKQGVYFLGIQVRLRQSHHFSA